MEAVLVEGSTRSTVTITGVLYGARVQVLFASGADMVLPASTLELTPAMWSELKGWFAVDGPGWMSELQFGVLERLAIAGPAGLLDSEYPWSAKDVVPARRVLRHRGLVGTADPRQDGESDGRQVRWRLTVGGQIEHTTARRLVRPVGGDRRPAVAATG